MELIVSVPEFNCLLNVLSTSLSNAFFLTSSLDFYFKRIYFVLIDNIFSETICYFCFCVFLKHERVLSLKLSLRTNVSLIYASSVVK